jgi:hypothetical protein
VVYTLADEVMAVLDWLMMISFQTEGEFSSQGLEALAWRRRAP